MKLKLIQKNVDKLKPKEKAYEVYDTDLPGFLLRVFPSGTMIYCVRYSLPGGFRGRIKFGSTKVLTAAQAREDARHALAEALKGIDPGEAKKRAKAHTLDGFLDVYQAGVHNRTTARVVQTLRASFADLLGKPLSEIYPNRIENWRTAKVNSGAAVATANRNIAYLKAALSKAVEWGLLKEHPLRHVKLKPEDRGSMPRYLSVEEEADLLAAVEALPAGDWLRPMILLAMNTGARRGELFKLEWKEVELAGTAPRLTLQGYKAKSGRTRHVPLNRAAIEALKAWQRVSGGSTGLVFVDPATGGAFTDISDRWRSFRRRAGLNTVRFHDLRHHFASRLVQAGANLNTVRELLGHSDFSLTQRYSHLAPEQKQAAVALLDVQPGNVVDLEAERKARQ